MHVAAAEGHRSLIEFLIMWGADVNLATAKDGLTPLHLSALFGHEALVRLLLRRGAEFDVYAADERDAEDLARERGHQEIANLLRGLRATATLKAGNSGENEALSDASS